LIVIASNPTTPPGWIAAHVKAGDDLNDIRQYAEENDVGKGGAINPGATRS
jgi:hypothetical protein